MFASSAEAFLSPFVCPALVIAVDVEGLAVVGSYQMPFVDGIYIECLSFTVYSGDFQLFLLGIRGVALEATTRDHCSTNEEAPPCSLSDDCTNVLWLTVLVLMN
jgi:hypothetical protein